MNKKKQPNLVFTAFCILITFILCSCSGITSETARSTLPTSPTPLTPAFTRAEDVDGTEGPLEGGITGNMIPDDKTAVKVARAYILSHLGEKALQTYNEIQVTYYKKSGVWEIVGASEDRSKGEVMIYLQQKDGKVLLMGMGAN